MTTMQDFNQVVLSTVTRMTEIEALLDASIVAVEKSEAARTYLGASAVGDECKRKSAFFLHGYPREREFPPHLLRVFQMGHDCEDQVAKHLCYARFDLRIADQHGEQFGFVVAGKKFAGHIDGVILSGPVDLPYPALWENKALKHSNFLILKRGGLKKFSTKYFLQIQLYMAYMGLGVCLLTAINRDNGEMYVERINFDAREAQVASDEAVKIIKSQNPFEVPRCTSDRTDYRCRFCDYPIKCWE